MDATNDEIVKFLSRGDTYGVESVEVIETHTAMVFLAGERAYKLKKSLRYSYLDYSTAELRRGACEAEVGIGRQFAPSLYIGVEPVTRPGTGRLAIGGEGAPVDWLVVMKRFDQACQFDQMAERGALTPELIRAVADEIAERHSRAPVARDFGGAAGLRKAIDITNENLRIAADTTLPAGQVEQWIKANSENFHLQSALLERRRLDDHVRACHGDLHLRNICLFEGRPTLFDALEFDPSLSNIDVLYDLAFLLMDLLHRGFDGLASLLFNRYLDRNDEADGLPALPLFMSVRAAIRSQVTAAQLTHSHADGHGRELREQASQYLSLALWLQQPMQPQLIAIGGLSGSGKSTLANTLAPRIGIAPGARILRTDILRKRLLGVPPETKLPASAYSPVMHGKTYWRLLEEVRLALVAGYSVIADAVFGRGAERHFIEEAAHEFGAHFTGLWLDAPVEVREKRVTDRVADASDATAEVARAQSRIGDLPLSWLSIDASGTPDLVARVAKTALGMQMI